MTVNATMGYIKSLLDGLTIPGQTAAMVAHVTPPVVDDDPDAPPTAYVWASDGEEKRQAVPRGTPPAAGWKTTTHTLSVWLTWPGDPSATDADTAFPATLDAVLQRLRSSEDPAAVSDPYTAASSVLVDVGEKMTWTLYGPRTLADQRWVRYDAEIHATVTEEFQA